MHKEPFTIEEDGFGSFRLFARVSFLNVFTDLHYDITLFDNGELHAFRTVRLDPKNSEEWIRYSQYGGVGSIWMVSAVYYLEYLFPLSSRSLCFTSNRFRFLDLLLLWRSSRGLWNLSRCRVQSVTLRSLLSIPK